VSSSFQEIWEYFTSKVLPVIKKWQLESVGGSVGKSVDKIADTSGIDIVNHLLDEGGDTFGAE
jgi:hypothetical protein